MTNRRRVKRWDANVSDWHWHRECTSVVTQTCLGGSRLNLFYIVLNRPIVLWFLKYRNIYLHLRHAFSSVKNNKIFINKCSPLICSIDHRRVHPQIIKWSFVPYNHTNPDRWQIIFQLSTQNMNPSKTATKMKQHLFRNFFHLLQILYCWNKK